MNKYPGMKNKFCAKGKITFINYRSGETVWTNPKDYLRYWAKELKNCLKEVDENKTKYEKYISWFDTDLKKRKLIISGNLNNKKNLSNSIKKKERT